MTELLREAARQFISTYCIARVPEGSKELLSREGFEFYRWQFYLRAAFFNPKLLELFASEFCDRFLDLYMRKPFQLCGVESSSLPLMVAIQNEAMQRGVNIPAFAIRKKAKEYGRRNIIEGEPLPAYWCFFIDDIISPNHATFWHAVNVLNNYGLKMAPNLFVVVAKIERQKIAPIQTSHGDILISSIFDLDDFDLLEAQ